MEEAIFYILAAVCLVAAVFMLVKPGVLSGAMSLAICMFGVSGIMVLLDAPYVALAHAMIFAGTSILAIFISAMMSDVRPMGRKRGSIRFGRVLAVVIAFYFTIAVVIAIMRPPFVEPPLSGEAFRSVYVLGRVFASEFTVTAVMLALAVCAGLIAAHSIIRHGLKGERG